MASNVGRLKHTHTHTHTQSGRGERHVYNLEWREGGMTSSDGPSGPPKQNPDLFWVTVLFNHSLVMISTQEFGPLEEFGGRWRISSRWLLSAHIQYSGFPWAVDLSMHHGECRKKGVLAIRALFSLCSAAWLHRPKKMHSYRRTRPTPTDPMHLREA